MKSSAYDESMRIGELAERFGLATHVLRHWEAMGLLEPGRVSGGRRRYGRTDLYRVAVILRAKEAGLALDDIRQLLATSSSAARRAVLERQQAELRARIASAQASLALVECALDCDHEDFATCPHFQAFVEENIPQPGRLTSAVS